MTVQSTHRIERNPMKLAAFDLETAKILPDRVADIKRYAPLGISCAALARDDGQVPLTGQGGPQMAPLACPRS